MAGDVVAESPHHVTQRGNRRQATCFNDQDYATYLPLIGASWRRAGTAVWAYCLIANHVHFVMVPSCEDGLRDVVAVGPLFERIPDWRDYLGAGDMRSTV